MERRGVLRRSAVVGLALASATTIFCAATGSAVMADPASPPRGEVPGAGVAGAVKDRYIVVLKDGNASPSEVRAAASSLTRAHGGSVRRVYTRAIRGFSAQLNAAQAKLLAKDADVAYVEQVHKVSATDTQSNPPSWGLDRIDQTSPVLSRSYTYPTTAGNVTAYVIDTGINISHQDFGGRASYGYDFVDGDAVADDCNGHGTHVAGTIGGTTYGVAKGVNLVAVRALDCLGVGTTEQVVAAVDWVTANAVKPAVANMSLGVSCDATPDVPACLEGRTVLHQAVQASITSGVTYAVAAGNSSADACGAAPANLPAAITVGATDNVDFRAWFSNFGSCLDVFAPGVQITSATIGSTTATATASGTSMASPHLAGAAALLLSANPNWTPQQVRDEIVTTGISGTVHDATGSPNRLLHVGATQAARSSVGFRAFANNKYVTAESAGTKPLIANRTAVGLWERFDTVDAGNGFIALKAKVNGKYVTAESAGAKPLIANRTVIGAWEKFQVINNTDGSVSFRANANGRYVTAESRGTMPLIANRTAIGTWEKFDYVAPAPTISIKANVNGKYVTAESAGAKPLIANRTAVGLWERFDLIDAGDGFVALKAHANGKYVTAESAGAKPLIANRTAIGDWEKFFVLTYNEDGSIYLGAWANVNAVTAGSGGSQSLIASRVIDLSSPTLGLGVEEEFSITAV